MGQAASSHGPCVVPRPENGCILKPEKNLAWMWKSARVECCNCFQLKVQNRQSDPYSEYGDPYSSQGNPYLAQEAAATVQHNPQQRRPSLEQRGGDEASMLQVASVAWERRAEDLQLKAPGSGYCQANSSPKHECDFTSSRGWNSCFTAVNTGQTAEARFNECEPPSPSNGCILQVEIDLVYSWMSNHPGVKCCNCFLRRDFSDMRPYPNQGYTYQAAGYSFAQEMPQVQLLAGDEEVAMLQLPFATAEGGGEDSVAAGLVVDTEL